jgi:hypothetical protein
MTHFFTFSLGDVSVVISILVALWKIEKWMSIHQIEHEILVDDYLQRKQLKTLPTRIRH